MANLKEIRLRIASVRSTMQITSAMKMVSASKLRKAQASITKIRPYSEKLTQIMEKLTSCVSEDMPYSRKVKQEKNILLIALTSNKGLCSTFNNSIIKLTLKRIDTLNKENKNIFLISFGKKGDAVFSKLTNVHYLYSQDDIWDKLTFDNVLKESEKVMNAFAQKDYDKVEIIYNRFKNAATQIPMIENYLPLEIDSNDNHPSNHKEKVLQNYIFSPSKTAIVENIIPQSLHTQFYKCFLDSFASEHGARMSSMNKATDNANSLLKDLTLTYNKQRQSEITNQIIEVCNGANAI